jgi:hypothetical protein
MIGRHVLPPATVLDLVLAKEGWTVLEKRFISRKECRGWRKSVVSLVDLALAPFGFGIRLEAAFAPCMAFAS